MLFNVFGSLQLYMRELAVDRNCKRQTEKCRRRKARSSNQHKTIFQSGFRDHVEDDEHDKDNDVVKDENAGK